MIGVHQDLRVDVNHHLIPFTRRTRIELLMQCCLGKQGQGVGLLLRKRRRLVRRRVLLVQHHAGRLQRAHQQRTGLRRQASTQDDRAVFVWIHVQRAG